MADIKSELLPGKPGPSVIDNVGEDVTVLPRTEGMNIWEQKLIARGMLKPKDLPLFRACCRLADLAGYLVRESYTKRRWGLFAVSDAVEGGPDECIWFQDKTGSYNRATLRELFILLAESLPPYDGPGAEAV